MRKLMLGLPAAVCGLMALMHLPLPQAAEALPKLAPPVTARIIAAPLDEISGVVRSRKSPDRYWVHNDSGDSARIFAITADGRSILPTYARFTRYGDERERNKQQWEGFPVLDAENVDWEDIAVDERYLYIADLGNNLNMRSNLVIYAISEIDPTASTRSAVIQKWPVYYPEQDGFPPSEWHFDSEAMFVADGELYVITKHRKAGRPMTFEPGAHLYRLGSRLHNQSNPLVRVDSSPLIHAATGADLSPDGSTLAVISWDTLWLFDRPAEGEQWLSAPHRQILLDRKVTRQAEAITWVDDDTLLIINEGRDLFRLSLSELAAAGLIPE